MNHIPKNYLSAVRKAGEELDLEADVFLVKARLSDARATKTKLSLGRRMLLRFKAKDFRTDARKFRMVARGIKMLLENR